MISGLLSLDENQQKAKDLILGNRRLDFTRITFQILDTMKERIHGIPESNTVSIPNRKNWMGSKEGSHHWPWFRRESSSWAFDRKPGLGMKVRLIDELSSSSGYIIMIESLQRAYFTRGTLISVLCANFVTFTRKIPSISFVTSLSLNKLESTLIFLRVWIFSFCLTCLIDGNPITGTLLCV